MSGNDVTDRSKIRGAEYVQIRQYSLVDPDERFDPETASDREFVGGFLLVIPRGIALWFIWPLAFAIWIVRLPFAGARAGSRLRVGQIAGWFDWSLIALLEASVLRPFTRHPSPFLPWSGVVGIEHGPSLHNLFH